MTLKAFGGRTYTPYWILSNLQVEPEGKIVDIEFEFIDGNLNYNILLRRPWIYAMAAVVSTYFRKISFPFQVRITIVDQLTFLPKISQATGSIPMIHGSSHSLQNVGVGLLKDPILMGNFSLLPPKLEIYCALFREFRYVFAWSYEEMPGIDSSIIEHEIKMYPDVKPVQQQLRQVHSKKAATIKAEVEKLLHAGFIYPVPLTDWVSNIVPVMKKKGRIRVCIDYRDVNQACPKDNYPTPFID
eukprot:PITA_19382